MGIFNSQHAKTNSGSTTTVIATNCHIDGTFNIDGSLHVDGHLSGRIECDGAITVGASGFIDGEINSEQLYVSGKFQGECRAKLVQILPSGLIEGTLFTEQLVIESGGNFYGDSRSFNDKKTELSLVHNAQKQGHSDMAESSNSATSAKKSS